MDVFVPKEKSVDSIYNWCLILYERLKQPFVVYSGDQTVWDDLRVSLLTAKVPASSAPDFSQVADDGAASIGVYGYHFADGEYLFFTVQMPHGWKEGSVIYPHIHFMTTSDVSPADNFGIGLEYTWTEIDEDIAATTSAIEIDISTGINSNGMHQAANLSASGIDGSGKRLSSIMLCRLYRQAAAADNYAADVIITDFDIHFEIDTHGSRSIWSK